jgi:hypothetical protein
VFRCSTVSPASMHGGFATASARARSIFFVDLVKLVHARGMKTLTEFGPAASGYPPGVYLSKDQRGCQRSAMSRVMTSRICSSAPPSQEPLESRCRAGVGLLDRDECQSRNHHHNPKVPTLYGFRRRLPDPCEAKRGVSPAQRAVTAIAPAPKRRSSSVLLSFEKIVALAPHEMLEGPRRPALVAAARMDASCGVGARVGQAGAAQSPLLG